MRSRLSCPGLTPAARSRFLRFDHGVQGVRRTLSSTLISRVAFEAASLRGPSAVDLTDRLCVLVNDCGGGSAKPQSTA